MNGVPKHSCLRFGIPSLDDLFGNFGLSHRAYGITVEDSEQVKVTVVGPDGSGKSILAFHLASRYAADALFRCVENGHRSRMPKVIYISTDLTIRKARTTWKAFELNAPNLREVPFYRGTKPIKEQKDVPADQVTIAAHLVELDPLRDLEAAKSAPPDEQISSLARFLRENPQNGGSIDVGFIDLIKYPVGDIWSLCNRLLGALDSIDGRDDQHLIIIDNVDGCDVMAGELNAFGDRSSVRARIMQAAQAASRKAHLLFVAEERGTGAQSLTDISDVVVRLSMREDTGYRFRAVEVLKARGQAIHRGDHILLLRSGNGSTTGVQENPDDPLTTNAYVQVIPSLHTTSRRVMNEPSSWRPVGGLIDSRRAGFGLPNLDELCGASDDPKKPRPFLTDREGLPFGTLCAILGESNTYKTPLAYHFLRRGFEVFTEELERLYGDVAAGGWESVLMQQTVQAILAARKARSAPPSAGGEESPPSQRPAKADSVATVLLEAHPGRAVPPARKGVEEGLAKLDGHYPVDSAVLLAIAYWAGSVVDAILAHSLRSHDVRKQVLEIAKACLPPEQTSKGSVFQRYLSGDKITGEDLLEAAVLSWRTRKIEQIQRAGCSAAKYLSIYREYVDNPGKRSKAQIAAEVSQRKPGAVSNEAEDQSTLDVEADAKRRQWSEENLFEFLQRRFPSSLARNLDQKSREELQNTRVGSTSEISPEMLHRILVNVASSNLDDRIQRARTNEEDLLKILQGLPGFEGMQRNVTLEALIECLLACLRGIGVASSKRNSDVRAALSESGTVNQPAPLPSGFDSILEAAPLIRVRKDDCSAADFSEWLFGISPKTHPYALGEGKAKLKAEVEHLCSHTSGKTPKYPILSAALVAMVLEFIRLGKLRRVEDAHLEDEMAARRKATETLGELHSWLEGLLKPEEPARAFREALMTFVSTARDGVRIEGGHLAALLHCASDLQGVLVNVKDNSDDCRVRVCRLVLESAAREGLLDGPAVLISTNEVQIALLVQQFDTWLELPRKQLPFDDTVKKLIAEAARDHFRTWTVVRRLEIHYLATTTLAHTVRRCVEWAQDLLFEGQPSDWADESDINARRQVSWNIRVVFDGLTALRQAHPNVESDALFLPALRFYISRESLTGVIVVSQPGRPDEAGNNAFERANVDLFLAQIRTWRVHFFGQIRVALTYLPQTQEHGIARFRELCLGANERLHVRSHFELYKGLEKDQPERVALEVRLVGDTRALSSYSSALDSVFSDVFPSVGARGAGARVVLADSSAAWTEKLRDFARSHRDTKLEHTLILQLDEHWAFRRSDALRTQERYLVAPCNSDVDPYQVFSETLGDDTAGRASGRFDSFDWNGHATGRADDLSAIEKKSLDRIPFCWDFGFLLCWKEAWNEAAATDDQCFNVHTLAGKKTVHVRDVWDQVRRADRPRGARPKPPETQRDGTPHRPPSEFCGWRVFMEAAAMTAAHRSLSTRGAAVLDLPLRGGESLACLLLEIWASEVYRKFSRSKRNAEALFSRFTTRSWEPSGTRGLIGLIAEPGAGLTLKRVYGAALAAGRLPTLRRHSLELFKAMLLLREAIDPSNFVRTNEPLPAATRPVNPDAVCARHWYGSACEFFDHGRDPDRFVPVRLPGHFSVRGDWYLAVARGSHSDLLADRALDLLSSRPANFERLQNGIGLPVRRIGDPRTRLSKIDGAGRKDWIQYRELASLGAEPKDDFFWLWRSTLGDYDAQARAFLHGVMFFMQWWWSLRNLRSTHWKNGFALYDALDRYEELERSGDKPRAEELQREIFKDEFIVNSLWEFPEICDELVDRLRRSTPTQ